MALQSVSRIEKLRVSEEKKERKHDDGELDRLLVQRQAEQLERQRGAVAHQRRTQLQDLVQHVDRPDLHTLVLIVRQKEKLLHQIAALE